MIAFKRILSCVVAAILILINCSFPAFALSSNVLFENEAEKFVFLPGSDYSDTDLFNGFKGMLPGDSRTQTVVISNIYDKFDRISVFLKAIPHNEVNHLSESVDRVESLESMKDFLSKLTMTVRNGSKVIFNGSPDQIDGLSSNVSLGTIAYGEIVKLDVEVSMPSELGNEYSNRIGEVDWVFTVQQVNDPVILQPTVNVTLSAIKLLDGEIPATDDFLFQLSDSDGNVLQVVNNHGVEVLFNSITYTSPGVYTYYLSEVCGNDTEIVYDPSVYTVTVTVQDHNGFLTSSVICKKNGIAFWGIPTFNNSTVKDEDPEYVPTFVSVWATKTFNRRLAVNSDYTFELYNEDGALLQTKQNVGGYVFFDRIKFDKVGSYVYYIREEQGTIEDMIYDSSEYKVTVDVREVGGKLEPFVSYEKNGLAYYDTPDFANRTETDPEIPPTSDSNVGLLILSCFSGVFAAVAVSFIFSKMSKRN